MCSTVWMKVSSEIVSKMKNKTWGTIGAKYTITWGRKLWQTMLCRIKVHNADSREGFLQVGKVLHSKKRSVMRYPMLISVHLDVPHLLLQKPEPTKQVLPLPSCDLVRCRYGLRALSLSLLLAVGIFSGRCLNHGGNAIYTCSAMCPRDLGVGFFWILLF